MAGWSLPRLHHLPEDCGQGSRPQGADTQRVGALRFAQAHLVVEPRFVTDRQR